MTRTLPFVIAVVVMVASAIQQGIWAERWDEFPELKQFAKQMDFVPMQVGDWKGELAPETPEAVRKEAGAERIMAITYRNTKTDEFVHVNLVCGRLRDVFYHTPVRCYPAHGFDQEGDTQQRVVKCGSDTAEFKTAVFKRTLDASKENLRIFWSWTAKGPWEAPSDPKWKYSGMRALYKLYVENPAEGTGGTDNSPSVRFISVFVPELTRQLFPESGAPAANVAPASTPTTSTSTAG